MLRLSGTPPAPVFDLPFSPPLIPSLPVLASYVPLYRKLWLSLKAQKTILESLDSRIASLLPLSTSTITTDSLTCISTLINTLLNVDSISLFESVDNALLTVRCLPDCLDKAFHIIGTFVNALIAINSVSIALGATQTNHIDDSFPESPHTEECSIVCRICDELIPRQLFEEHTESCVMLYTSEATISSVDTTIRSLQREIAETYLQVGWPNSEDIAIEKLFPALHLSVLFSQVILVDPRISDSYSELNFISSVLSAFHDGLTPFISKVIPLIREKIRITTALRQALLILRRPKRRTECSIADFTFLKRISKGAFATVFLAVKKQTGDIFAIKATPRRTLNQKNQVQRLLIEKDILLKFRSPWIVKFYYSMVGAHNLYLVTEFVPGGDLFSLLQNVGSLTENHAKFYGQEVLFALGYLRENGIIHRDIKPDNILVTQAGHLKLTDFGLSRLGMVDRSDLSQAASLVGTPDYVAPEIILNQSHSFSADYWSLGVMLYEFVIGVPPFHAGTVTETYHRALMGIIRWPENCEVSAEFRDLIERLLATNPAARLGHTGIAEILNHNWFVGVSEGPPFVPRLANRRDTAYFEQRYEFDDAEDAAILEDLQDCTSMGRGHCLGMETFGSVDFAELAEANRTAAEEFDLANAVRGRRMSSPPPAQLRTQNGAGTIRIRSGGFGSQPLRLDIPKIKL
jgi:tRNA A-37 threonylcarbamoyl transferase component Bud32